MCLCIGVLLCVGCASVAMHRKKEKGRQPVLSALRRGIVLRKNEYKTAECPRLFFLCKIKTALKTAPKDGGLRLCARRDLDLSPADRPAPHKCGTGTPDSRQAG